MISRIDPPEFKNASTVQVDSTADDPWQAIDEIEEWAAAQGLVRTSEFHPRQVLIEGKRRFRAICYRISEEERAALELAHHQMIERGNALKGILPELSRRQE